MSAWFEEHFEQGRQKGIGEGRAESVLRILAIRGIQVDDAARERILSCTDLTTLGLWLERAVTATRISDVLEDLAQ